MPGSIANSETDIKSVMVVTNLTGCSFLAQSSPSVLRNVPRSALGRPADATAQPQRTVLISMSLLPSNNKRYHTDLCVLSSSIRGYDTIRYGRLAFAQKLTRWPA